ncbi:MAG: type VI secretion system tip protein TssI/VgrG, partial [Bryobacteraceae bacterium]
MSAIADPVKYTQENRRIAITTALGEDVLLLRGFGGYDGLSQLFRFDLDLLSTEDSIDFDKVVGEPATIRVSLAGEQDRYFNGIISRFGQIGPEQGLIAYRAELVPKFWVLTRTADCRVFQDQSVLEIIKQLFSEKQIDFSMQKLTKTYRKREYCVQYRETDFNFVSRLIEEEGISYFFVHGEGKHTLIFADSPAAYPNCPFQAQARYHPPSLGQRADDVVSNWQPSQQVYSDTHTLNEFNFKDPGSSMLATLKGKESLEIYDFPGIYPLQPQGETLARIRMEESATGRLCIAGNSDCRSFTSGHKFTLTGHFRTDQNREYLLTHIHHSASLPANFMSGSESGQADLYTNTFECIPSSTSFRPARVSPKPVIQGSQTAIVVGKEGEEITQDFGRIKVHFHWDRKGPRNEKSSCWIRVAQTWAGNGWGAISIPRVGQEVVVTFLEGDPDQPLITGSVYNGQQVPPYLPASVDVNAPPFCPDSAEIMGFRSNTTKGGGGYNEIIIKDTKDKELVRIHGQKDMYTTV